MQADYLHGRLALLKERIEDQEDEINIRLDHRRAHQAGSLSSMSGFWLQASCMQGQPPQAEMNAC